MKVLFATSNPSKVKRFEKQLKKLDIDIVTLNDINLNIEVEEDGKDAVENALIKARAYSKICDMPVLAMDDNLFIDNIPDSYQPGMFVRRVNDKRLSDEEMLEHYTNLVKNFGGDGKLTCRWVYGMAIINNNETFTYT